jgi:Fe-S-cluster containining protein
MQISRIVKSVNRVYENLNKANKNFISTTGLHCPTGCAKCCHGEKISASPLEFIPFAYHLYSTGILEDKYWEYKQDTQKRCFLVEGDNVNSSGKCSQYEHRGLICRMFGSSASMDKNGIKKFSACNILKELVGPIVNFDTILQKEAPVYSNYYMQLRSINNEYGGMLLPVNLAILKSMEIVYFNTRGKRRRKAS